MSESDAFEMPAQQELITDREELAKAGRGADTHCPYCGARNPIDAQKCTQCGGDLVAARKRAAGGVLGAFQAGPAADVKCPSCGTPNPANATKCKQCGSPLTTAPQPAAPARARQGGLGVVGVIALAAIAIFFILLTRTSDTSARVQAVNWERSIAITALGPVEYENWIDLIPADGRMGQCTERVRRTQEEPAPNSDKICGTPYAVDQGDGTAKVVQDCQYQVTAQWCAYTRDEWVDVDAVVARGNDLQPYWPELSLSVGQRPGERQESYQVVFDADGRQYPYTVETAEEFARFAIDSRWTLKVNGLGAVTDAQPAQ
jgi:ribosomal protein L40E